jgi:hypothetical protein
MTSDEQEARSIYFGHSAIIVVPLSSGNWAVFNRANELCGIVPAFADAQTAWRKSGPEPKINLKDLGLL